MALERSIWQWPDSAALLALATGSCFIVGYAYLTGYYHEVGFSPADLGFPFFYYMEESFDVLFPPFAFFILYLAGDATIASLIRARHRGVPKERFFVSTSPSGMALIPANLWALFWLLRYEDDLGLRVLGTSILRIATIVIALVLIAGALTEKHRAIRLVSPLGHQIRNTLLVFMLLVVAGLTMGAVRVQLALDGCRDVPLVSADEVGLPGPGDYWVVAHQQGNVYLRNATPGKNFVVIPDGFALSITWGRLVDDCDRLVTL